MGQQPGELWGGCCPGTAGKFETICLIKQSDLSNPSWPAPVHAGLRRAASRAAPSLENNHWVPPPLLLVDSLDTFALPYDAILILAYKLLCIKSRSNFNVRLI